jgi:hypothetical protein
MNKRKIYGVLFCFAAVIGAYAYFLCSPSRITAWEVRLYICIVLLILLVLTFAVLRVYNAMVINSQMLRDLNRTIRWLGPKLQKLEKSMDLPNRLLGQAVGRLKTSIDTLIRVLTKSNA